jgi:hypothetical protein
LSDVRDIYVTAEVAKQLDLTPAYLIRLAKVIELDESEFREAGKRNYLFSKEAVEKIRKRNEK